MSNARYKLELIIKEMDRVAILIDGHTTHNATRSIRIKINWQKFQDYFMDLGRLRCINYYLTVINSEIDDLEYDLDIDRIQFVEGDKPWWASVVNWMSYNNFNITLKKGREFKFVNNGGNNGIKTSIDTSIALDAMKLENIDHVIFLTGNTEHVEIVKAIKEKGIVVTVIGNSHKQLEESGFLNSKDGSYPFTASKKLIKAANHFIDFLDLAKDITDEEQ